MVRKRNAALGMLLALVTLACLSDIGAAYPVPKIKLRPKPAGSEQYDTQALCGPVALPYLPEYSGKTTWSRGHWYPKLKKGKCFMFAFLCKDKPDVVLDWWKEALPMSGWKLNEYDHSPTSLAADRVKDGLSVNVRVINCAAPGYKCEFEVRYRDSGLKLQ